MPELSEVLAAASGRGVAVGHFNVAELVALKAVAAAARELAVPAIVGVSEGERSFFGVAQIAALVASLRAEVVQPIFLNADHTHTLARAEEAARAGFDMIGFDGTALPLEENARETARVVAAVKSIAPAIVVEGEIGYIGTGSQIHARAPEGLRLTTADEARQFAAETGVDVLAPAVGNQHGLLRSMIDGEVKKHLAADRIAEIRAATGLPLTLHGGSGTDDADLRRAIAAGITIVHVSTELRLAWRRGLEAALARSPDEVVPYTLLQPALAGVEVVVRARLALFNAR
jgi:fructose-bisphosphate aldolase class II